MSSPTMCRVSSPARLLALAGALALALALLTPVAAHAQDVSPARVDGETRFHTAANIATLTFDQADVAHVAFAGNFPDALAASFAAGSVDGPILLSETDSVPEPTWDALEELDAQRVVLVGGTAVLSEQVAAAFADQGYEVDRIDGVDRYQTASSVAMRYGTTTGVGEIDDQRTALLASGADFPDALSAGGIAAGLQLPLFLTPPDRTEFSVNTSLEQLDIERIVVIGGTAAVSSGVVEHYQAQGYEVERWGGATRTDTARIVADQALARLGFTPDLTLLARGDNFPDALTASIHGGAASAPLLLSATPGTLSAETIGWLRAACPDVDAVRAIGGTAAIAAATLEAAVTEAGHCLEPESDELIGTPSGDDRASDPFPGDGDTAQLIEVRAGVHDGFDRVVLQFRGPDEPGWQAQWEDEPITHDPSEQEIEVEGEAFIRVTFAPAVAQWAGGTYDGPERIEVNGDVVTEVVQTGDFEGHLSWVIGLRYETEYATGFLANPMRFVVDVVE